MRTKEFLRKRGVEFESFNIMEDDSAMQKLLGLGIKTVPVVIVGDRWAHGVQLDDVAALLGFANEPDTALAPDDLWQRLETVVAAASRYIEQVPDDKLTFHPPDRPRTTKDLAFHVFLIAEGYIKSIEGDGLASPTDVSYPAPPELRTGAEVSRHGREVLARLQGWWPAERGKDHAEKVSTYYGPQTKQALLERSAWHAAQHTRQLMMYLESSEIEPDKPLTKEDLSGLPLPDSVWH